MVLRIVGYTSWIRLRDRPVVVVGCGGRGVGRLLVGGLDCLGVLVVGG